MKAELLQIRYQYKNKTIGLEMYQISSRYPDNCEKNLKK